MFVISPREPVILFPGFCCIMDFYSDVPVESEPGAASGHGAATGIIARSKQFTCCSVFLLTALVAEDVKYERGARVATYLETHSNGLAFRAHTQTTDLEHRRVPAQLLKPFWTSLTLHHERQSYRIGVEL